MDFKFIWMIQNSDNLNIISCFTDKVAAEKYIFDHQLKCILTQYPLDISVYDWVFGNRKVIYKKLVNLLVVFRALI